VLKLAGDVLGMACALQEGKFVLCFSQVAPSVVITLRAADANQLRAGPAASCSNCNYSVLSDALLRLLFPPGVTAGSC
jgi:hypothetical protein